MKTKIFFVMDNKEFTRAEFSFANNRKKIIIEVCDLFEQKGLKVVHCHNTFDTSDEVMRSHSVMGQFIKKCQDENVDLDKIIDTWTEKHSAKAFINEQLPCRKKTFTVGTTCPVKVNREQFVLASFENLEKFLMTGSMDINSYMFFLDNLWKNIGKGGIDNEEVNVPSFGNKIVNITNFSFTPEQKLSLIALSFFKSVRNYGTMRTLRICVYKGDVKDVDLGEWYENWQNVLLPFLYQFSKLPIGLKEIFHSGSYVGMPFDVIPTSKKRDSKDKLKVFISHAWKDADISKDIYDRLTKEGFECWMDLYDIRPGHKYAGEIIRGFKSSDVIVAILSRNSLYSEGVLNEMDNAYKKSKYVIPFRVDDTELTEEFEFYLSNKQWINAFPNYEDHMQDLIAALNDFQKKPEEDE